MASMTRREAGKSAAAFGAVLARPSLLAGRAAGTFSAAPRIERLRREGELPLTP